MRATKELLFKLESTDELDYLHVLELRVSILEYMNHLMHTYPLQGREDDGVNECIAKLQTTYSVLQQLSNNKNSDFKDNDFVKALRLQTKESVECIQEILTKENVTK
jgi:hypothetical protein